MGRQPARIPSPPSSGWQDDRTTRTTKRDAGGSEVIWRPRAETPWRFVSQGPKGISLGATKQKIEETFQPHGTSGGATVYRAPSKSPHEMYLVWYADGRADRTWRCIGQGPGVPPGEVTAALKKAWIDDVDDLGAIRRKAGRRGPNLGSYSWHDDATRIQTFAQSGDDGARVLTEWRAWPVTPPKATAKR